jgi:hypothetical protein
MTKAICRIGDTVTGTCQVPAGGHPRPFTGTWQVGSGIVKCDGIGVVREDDTGLTDCGHTFKALGGVSTLTAEGKKIQRVGDAVEVIGGGTGTSTTGSGTSSST